MLNLEWNYSLIAICLFLICPSSDSAQQCLALKMRRRLQMVVLPSGMVATKVMRKMPNGCGCSCWRRRGKMQRLTPHIVSLTKRLTLFLLSEQETKEHWNSGVHMVMHSHLCLLWPVVTLAFPLAVCPLNVYLAPLDCCSMASVRLWHLRDAI